MASLGRFSDSQRRHLEAPSGHTGHTREGERESASWQAGEAGTARPNKGAVAVPGPARIHSKFSSSLFSLAPSAIFSKEHKNRREGTKDHDDALRADKRRGQTARHTRHWKEREDLNMCFECIYI